MLPPSSNSIEPGSFLTQLMRVSNVSKVSFLIFYLNKLKNVHFFVKVPFIKIFSIRMISVILFYIKKNYMIVF